MKIASKINQILKTQSFVAVLVFFLFGCQSLKYTISNKDISKEINKSTYFKNHLTGFSLYDPQTDKFLCNYNDHLYFTPASNVKILTSFTCLQKLGDSLASFSFTEIGDSLFIRPLGDPTFLHPDFPTQKALSKLKGKNIYINYPSEQLSKYGSGWAWDDYPYGFQVERSWLPIYGNSVRIFNQYDSMKIIPSFFEDYVEIYKGIRPGDLIYRTEFANIFNAWIESDSSIYQREIPFIVDYELISTLLTDTLQSTVVVVDSMPLSAENIFSHSTKYVISMMMLPSDNFLAEQLLIHCALMNGFTDIDVFRAYLLKQWSVFLPDPIIWKDGSGLSRYNMITPRTFVSVLDKIYKNESWETIEYIFPIGGISGTIKDYYKADQPYVYAKTGTLSNNHNLSGYLKTKSGKTLIFSLMNNNYITKTSEVKQEMEKLLGKIHDAY